MRPYLKNTQRKRRAGVLPQVGQWQVGKKQGRKSLSTCPGRQEVSCGVVKMERRAGFGIYFRRWFRSRQLLPMGALAKFGWGHCGGDPFPQWGVEWGSGLVWGTSGWNSDWGKKRGKGRRHRLRGQKHQLASMDLDRWPCAGAQEMKKEGNHHCGPIGLWLLGCPYKDP
jgi:hypothetical protein